MEKTRCVLVFPFTPFSIRLSLIPTPFQKGQTFSKLFRSPSLMRCVMVALRICLKIQLRDVFCLSKMFSLSTFPTILHRQRYSRTSPRVFRWDYVRLHHPPPQPPPFPCREIYETNRIKPRSCRSFLKTTQKRERSRALWKRLACFQQRPTITTDTWNWLQNKFAIYCWNAGEASHSEPPLKLLRYVPHEVKGRHIGK